MFVESWLCEWVGNGMFKSALSEMMVLVLGMTWFWVVGGFWSCVLIVVILLAIVVICCSMFVICELKSLVVDSCSFLIMSICVIVSVVVVVISVSLVFMLVSCDFMSLSVVRISCSACVDPSIVFRRLFIFLGEK